MTFHRTPWLLLMLLFFVLPNGRAGVAYGFGDDALTEAREAMERQAWAKAIGLGHAQIRLKPELAHAQIGLFKIYWRFLVETDTEKARRWLRQQKTDHAAFFVGEAFRRKVVCRE